MFSLEARGLSRASSTFLINASWQCIVIGAGAEQAQRERMGGESLETYQAVHRLLVEVSGDSDLRQLGRTFVENEEKSFAYFNYINELNNNSTTLKDRINKLRVRVHTHTRTHAHTQTQVPACMQTHS